MDTNWCSYCDKAVSPYSNSLYCSDQCLQKDALQNHPMLGYNFSEYRGFFSSERDHHPRQTFTRSSSTYSEDESALSALCCGAVPSLSSSFASSSYLSVKSPFAVVVGPTTTPLLPLSHHHLTTGRKNLLHASARLAAIATTNSLSPSA